MKIVTDDRLDDFIDSLPGIDKAQCGHVMELLIALGKNLGMPHSKKIHAELWELRTKGAHAIRLLYGVTEGTAYLVHGFIKKTNKTPKREIDTALKRLYNLK